MENPGRSQSGKDQGEYEIHTTN